MDITLTMLLDLAFPGCSGKGAVLRSDTGTSAGVADGGWVPGTEPSQPVRGIRIWDGTRTKPPNGENSRDLLYLKNQKPGVLLMLGGQKIPLENGLAFAKVFNKLEEAFTVLRDWDMRLHQGIIENKGLQYMIDVSEDIFRHTMAITDSGYKMIAHSKRDWGSDLIFQTGVKKGYLSADAIDQMDRAGFIFEKKGIVFRRGIEGLSCPMLNGTVFIEKDYRYMLTMLFPEKNLTEGIYELFAFFLGQLTLYLETNGDASRIRRFAWMSLLADLADGKCGPNEFAERNRYSGLPEGGAYRLVSLRREDGTMREHVEERLEQLLPGKIVFVHGEGVLILLMEEPSDAVSHDSLDEAISKIAPVVAEKHLYACVSDRFETLCDLHRAYVQSESAYSLGLRISRNRTLEKLGIAMKEYDNNIFRYSDYYPYDMISENPVLMPEFRMLLSEDQKADTGNLRLIYSYLTNDCNKTHAATELFMHRNNVIYRIGKLEETLGVSFSDERIKTAFRLSFLALELLTLSYCSDI